MTLPDADHLLDFHGFLPEMTLRTSAAGLWLRAYQARVGRDVLLKAPERGDELALESLRREVRMLGRLRHAGFLNLYDFHADAPVPFGVYELPGGASLEHRVVEDGPLRDLGETLDVFLQLAHIVAALHSAGLRLFQAAPEDFYLADDGRVRLVNLERVVEAGETVEETGTLDLPLWRAPGKPGIRADLYLLGLHYLFLLTGKVPVPHADAEAPRKAANLLAEYGNDRQETRADAGRSRAATRRCREQLAALVRRMLEASSAEPSLDAAQVVASLKELRARWDQLPRSQAHRWERAALFVLALGVGGWLGTNLWQSLTEPDGVVREEPREREDVPVAAGSVSHSAGRQGSAGNASAGDGERDRADSATPGSTAGDAGRVASETAPEATTTSSPSSSPPTTPPGDSGHSGATPTSAAPTAGGSEVAAADLPAGRRADRDGDSGSASIPLIDPPALPGPLDRFLSRAGKLVSRHPEFPLDAARRDELAELLEESLALGARDGGLKPAQRRQLAERWIDLAAILERDRLESRLFSGDVVELEDGRIRVRYDFSSRRQLADWQAAGESSRVDLVDGHLTILGNVFQVSHLRWRGPFRLSWRLGEPPHATPQRNNNVVVSFERQGPGDASTSWCDLFGFQSHVAQGHWALSKRTAPILLPATLHLRRSGALDTSGEELMEVDDPLAGWRPLWLAGEEVARATRSASREFSIEWDGRDVVWRCGARRLGQRVAGAGAGDGEGETVARFGFRTFATLLEIEELAIEGTIDHRTLEAAARSRAAARLPQVLRVGGRGD